MTSPAATTRSRAGAFTQLRTEALTEALTPVRAKGGRRALDAQSVALEALSRADWRDGVVADWGVLGAAASAGRTWRRERHALDALAGVGLATEARGSLRVSLEALVHQRDAEDGPWVELVPGAIEGLACHHGLDRLAADVFTGLVLAADPETSALSETSQTALSSSWGVGWIGIHGALADLVEAGVVEAEFCRGRRVTVSVPGRAAVVRPQAHPRPHRHQRRRAASPGGPADHCARALWTHFHLGDLPPTGLVRALRDALRDGADQKTLMERVVAGGGLGGTRDPAAVICWRVREAAEALAEARRRAEEARARRKATEEALSEQLRAEEEDHRRAAEESRWVAATLGPSALATLAARFSHSGSLRLPRQAVAGAILAWARGTVAAGADMDPAAALADGLGHDPPPGEGALLPRCPEGPTLTEALAD
ncbi:MAG: hypothetical protein ACRD0J_18105 [Acidimicrobiales bacterium]